ncbi:MAG: dihydrofolate reductase [Rhodothalassiaceae bacterium]|nr:MAG: dihydrofolate reductase [Rhodothalassiaceae bacterium]
MQDLEPRCADDETEIVLVAARALNGVIGHRGRIPWHLPADLRRFREITWAHPVVMGRRTFESLPKPLPGRLNIVLSTRENPALPEGVLHARDPEEALRLAREGLPGRPVMVIGGEAVYRAFLPRAARLELTEVALTPEGDAFFPAFDEDAFAEVMREEHPAEGDRPAFTFRRLLRRPAP